MNAGVTKSVFRLPEKLREYGIIGIGEQDRVLPGPAIISAAAQNG